MKTALQNIRTAACLVAAIAATQLTRAATPVWNGTNNISVNTNWSRAGNWVGGVAPGTGDNVKFYDNGAAAAGTVNNVVDAGFANSIASLQYGNTNGSHTTLIAPGVTLNLTGGLIAGTETDKGSAQQETNAISGPGAALVMNNTSSNLTVRQCSAINGSLRSTLDLSGLDTFNATLNNLLVGQQISTTLYRGTGTLLLARTNLLTLAGGFIVADNGQNAGGQNQVGFGQTNALFTDSFSVALSKGNALVQFNPVFATPALFLRGKTATRVSTFRVADNSILSGVTGGSTGTIDLSGGSVDAQVGTLYVGRGQNGAGSGASTGTLTLGAGTFDADVAEVGYQQSTANASVTTGTINVNGAAQYIVNTSLRLARYVSGTPLPVGTLNINGGTVVVKGAITAGGGTSTIAMTGGTLVVTNAAATVGAAGAPIGSFNLNNSTLNLAALPSGTNIIVSTLNNAGTANQLSFPTLPSIYTYPITFHLISYATITGDPANLTLGSLPSASPAYAGYISNNTSALTFDLVVTGGPVAVGPPAPPTGLTGAAVADGQVVLNWIPSIGASNYTVLRSTTSGSGYAMIASGVTGTSYTDSTAADGVKRYYYEVKASNNAGTGAPSAEVGVLAALQVRFTFADTGTTTTDSISGVTLNLLDSTGAAADYHGSTGSGVAGSGKSLDFSSNPCSSPAKGPVAYANSSPGLGFGIISNFTATLWIKPDTDFNAAINSNSGTNNPRLFALGTAATDFTANPGLGLKINSYGTAPLQNGLVLGLNGNQPALANFATYPGQWTFVAMTYDGTNLSLYAGSAGAPATLLYTTTSYTNLTMNFGTAASLLIGNTAAQTKGVDGWFGEFRFYVVAAGTSLLESIRQASTPITIGNLYPNGSMLLQGTNKLSFTAASPNGINAGSIQVLVNGSNVSSGLVVSGPSASRSVTYTGLPFNQGGASTLSISVTDAAGLSGSDVLNYDSFSSTNYTWEAEDFDFSGGQFIDNPAADAYANLVGYSGIDENIATVTGNHVYRPSDNIGTDVSPDTPRLQYSVPQPTNDYYVGWWANSAWINYTRTYPAGRFNIYARLAGGIGASVVTLSRVTSGQGTSSQMTTNLGTFSFTDNNWNSYAYVPLRDGFGNLAGVMLGGQDTLRVTTDGGANANFFMLVPAQPSVPVIANVFPDGLKLMEPASVFSFTALSPITTINNNGIQVTLNGSNITPQLVITGYSTNKNVSYSGLVSNVAYTAVITVTDANGVVASSTVKFDTFAPSLVWEAEDYDFNGGQFIDNPVLSSSPIAGSYFGQYGYEGIDKHDTINGGPELYRLLDPMSTDVAGDVPRQNFLDAIAIDPAIKDYEVGYFVTNEWVNFTRTYPTGSFNVYARLAEGPGTTGSATLSLVTNGWGTSSQATTLLGRFSFLGTGWQAYNYVPLRDTFGNLAILNLGGTSTLRLTSATSAGVNANFLMLVAARQDLPTITQVYPDGSNLFEATNKLSFTVSSPHGISTSNIRLTLNGVDVSSSLLFSGSASQWTVTYAGLLPNSSYTALITVTDNSGNTVGTGSTFDTFSPAYFTWEAEDFDFNGGQFIDNPVPSAAPVANSYYYYPKGDPANVAQVGIDVTTPSAAAGEVLAYRPFEACGTDLSLDTVRTPFAAVGASDYYVGWWDAATWLNYTRTFPTNTFHIYARMAYNGAFSASCSVVTSGWGTPNQADQVLGTFSGTGTGFQAWQWVPLLAADGQPAVVSLGGVSTLKMTSGTRVNANFYMLVPAPQAPANVMLGASLSGSSIVLSFPTQVGFTYTLLTKTNLTDAAWSPLSAVAGDGSLKSLNEPANGGKQFYRLSIQ